jgi:hypothetical protein
VLKWDSITYIFIGQIDIMVPLGGEAHITKIEQGTDMQKWIKNGINTIDCDMIIGISDCEFP